MGWFYSNAYCNRSDRKRLIAELTAKRENERATLVSVAHCLRGNILWIVWERTVKGEEPTRFIGCDILAYGGYEHGWGYKPLDEDCGPCYYSCPIKYIKMAGEPLTDNARLWREDVIRVHAENKELRRIRTEKQKGLYK